MVTLPKLIDPGLTPKVPVAVVPLPLRDTHTDGLEALELKESVTLSVPVADGEKVTDRLTLPPAGSV